jgi:pimeloyl-ACP methyl ester carboxylesterase
VATLIALDDSAKVKTLGVVGGGTLVTPPNPIYREWADHAATIADARDRVRYLVGANSYADHHLDDDYVDAMSKAFGSDKSRAAQRHFTGEVFERFHEELRELAQDTRLRIGRGELAVPTLVTWGYNDPSARIDVAGSATMDLFLGHVAHSSMHIFSAAGHYCFRERPEEFGAVTGSFVDGIQ